MRRSRSVLVLFVGLVFGLSFAIPAEDIPETLYDESESLPYESALPLSIVLQESDLVLQSVLTSGFQLPFDPIARRAEISSGQRKQPAHPMFASIPILNLCLRC
jgi:hypothetical protein